jgi:high-affinity iron transporter
MLIFLLYYTIYYSSNSLFNVAVAVIFAREVLEASIIIGQYRTVIIKSDYMTEERKKRALWLVTKSASIAGLLAILVVLAVAVPLGILSGELDPRVVEIIEGFSKVIAAVCILQLSVKIPVWLGIYKRVSLLPWKKYEPKAEKNMDMLTDREIYFNVAWNIWREVAEVGVFLIPFFLASDELKSIPISALTGTAVALVLGLGIYWANNRMNNKAWLAFVMSGLTLFLSVGLFVGGCHEFEEVWGETPKVWVIENDFWSHKTFPMVLLKPFGYSSSRTVLQMCCFWLWLALGLFLHYVKWSKSKQAREMDTLHEAENEDIEKNLESKDDTSSDEAGVAKDGEYTAAEEQAADADVNESETEVET